MNKRVKSLMMLLASVVGIGAMAGACGQVQTPHEHTYEEKWTADAEGHWHEATCDCEDVLPVKTAHVDENNDAVCDICEFTDHEHTYAEAWSSDENTHWHAADCGHDVAKQDEAAHADADENGKCDVCEFQVGEAHEHTYATDWSYDAEYHWHAPSCGHDVEVVGKEAHNLNDAGDCTICGAHINDVDTLDIEAVLAATIANENKIKSGSVIAIDKVYGGTGMQELENGKTDKVNFELGNGTSYIKWESYDMFDVLKGTEEQWHQKLGEEEYFGVAMLDESENPERKLSRIASDDRALKGYTYFPGTILESDADDTSTLANTFMGLYNKMKAGVNVSNAVEGYDEATGKYAFAYTYYSVHVTTSSGAFNSIELHLYNVAVTFSVNEDMIIDEADWYVEVYRDYEADSDLNYTHNNGVIEGEVTLKDTANPSIYVLQVRQESGERTYENPYLKENVIPTSFELSYVTKESFDENSQLVIEEEEVIAEALEIMTGTYARFHISSYLPETANPSFLDSTDFSYSFVNKDANSTAQCWWESDDIINGYSTYSNTLNLKLRDPGEYTITISIGDLTKTFDLTVLSEQAPDLDEDTDTTINVATTDTYGYFDLYSYTAKESGTYTFTLPAGLGFQTKESYDAWGAPQVDFYDNVDGATVEIAIAAGKTVDFYVGAIEKATWVINVACVPGDVGGGDVGGGDVGGDDDNQGTIGDIAGTYYSGESVLVINDNGTMTWTHAGNVFNYTYVIDGNTISYSLNGNPSYTEDGPMAQYFGYLVFGADGKPEAFVYYAETYTLSTENNAGGDVGGDEGGDEPVENTLVIGANTITVTEDDITAGGIDIAFAVVEAGTYKFASNDLLVRICDAEGTMIATGSTYLEAGNYIIKIVTAYVGSAGNYALTIEYTAPEADDNEADGSMEYPYTIETLPTDITINSDTYNMTYYLYTTTDAGTITLTYSTENDSWANIFNIDDGEDSYMISQTTVVSYAVAANATYRIGLGTWTNPGEVTISITFTAGEVGGDDEGGDNEGGNVETEEPAGYLGEGFINEIIVTEADLAKGYVLYAFNVWTSGNYELISGDLGILSITDSEGNEVEAVEWGVYNLIENGSYLVKINTGWVFNAGTYELNVTYQYPEGAQENPIELWDVGEYTASYAGNYAPAIWYSYTVYEDGVLTVSTTSETATIMLGMKGANANECTGTASMNVLAGMTYTIAVAEFEATEAVDIAFTVAVTAGEYVGDGTANTPAMIGFGEVEVSAPDWDAAYYAYKATAAGVLTLAVDYENADWNVKIADAEAPIYPVEGVITVEMYEGQVIIISVSTWDFSAATYTINATWKAAPEGVYEGVSIALGSNNLTIAENTYIQVDVQGFETGDYTVTWDNENVIVTVDGMPFASGDTFYSYNVRYPVTFVVYDANYAAADVTLTIEKVVALATTVALGDNTVTVTDTWNGTTVEFTAAEAGTYTFTAGANAVLGYDYANYIPGESFSATLEAGAVVSFIVLTEDYMAGDAVVTVAKAAAEGGDEGGDEPATNGTGTQADPYIVTELPYTLSFETGFDVYVKYTATEDCNITISYTGGTIDGLPGAFEKDMATKTYNGTVAAGTVLNLNFYSGIGQSYTVTATPVQAPEQGGDEGGETPDVGGGEVTNPTLQGSGTEADPYIVEALPFTYTVTGSKDFYIKYTVTEDCMLKLTYPQGNYITGVPGGFDKDTANYCYIGDVKAGDVLMLNPWGNNAGDYTISVFVVEEPTPDEGGSEEGGDEVVGTAVVYLGANSSGRLMQVTINATAGTMSVIRAASAGNSLDTNYGASEAIYNYSFDGTTVTATHVSGTLCVFTWNADGTPLSIAWNGVAYTDFKVQA